MRYAYEPELTYNDKCMFLFTVRQLSVADATDNSQPMSDINPHTPTTYEEIDVSRQGPVSYQRPPPRSEQDYYNVDRSANSSANTPYEELNVNTQRPPVYDQLTIES